MIFVTPDPPDSPGNFTVVDIQFNGANFSWSPPVDIENVSITGYNVKVLNLHTRTEMVFKVEGNTSTTITVDVLIPYTNYSAKVSVNSTDGESPYSDSVYFQTKESCECACIALKIKFLI